MNDDYPADADRDIQVDDLNGWDHIHFGIASAGFFLSVSGAVLSSWCIFFWGFAVLAWGMAYFVAHNVEN